MAKKIAIISTVLILLTGIGLGGWFVYNEVIRPQIAYAEASSIMTEVKTAEFAYSQTAEIEYDFNDTFQVELEPFDYISDATGSYDIEAEKMYIDMDMDFGEIFGSVNGKMYLDGDNAKMELNGERIEGTTDELGDTAISIDDVQSEQLWADIDDFDFEYEGIVEVEGKKAYRYEVLLDGADVSIFEDIVIDFAEGTLEGMELDMEVGDAEVEGVSYKVWVSVDDFQPIKEELVIDSLSVDVPNIFKLTYSDYETVYVYTSVNEEIEIPSL